MDDLTFRKAMGKFATGVTVVTTQVGKDIRGMTANAFMSVSLNPKLVVISIDENANIKNYINVSGKFAVSVLNEEQQDMSAYFAGQIEETTEIEFNWFNNMPTIKNSLVNLTCDVHDTVIAGDHILYIGKVTDVCISDGAPLAFFEGKYKQIQALVDMK
ncbi:flavin reductase family protein [Virgibacillus sp. C22-A2]|uniref:Flavin reductase family protein n=1 Tax=Virgibacillus tibetensis TaxID=3042313 RepID=A0ABU6KD55_9BACI|nr:flavin reductase family protein [Virgibacillus sp. C22-A2]